MVSRDVYDNEQAVLPRAKAPPAAVLRKKSYVRPIALKKSAVNASNLKSMQATQNKGGDVRFETAASFAAFLLEPASFAATICPRLAMLGFLKHEFDSVFYFSDKILFPGHVDPL
jgi:hypothetical protein